ncbi:MAG: hypothetical protein LBV80_03820 [Deltaproteobacteria bacterium]|jgi:hypothetical protein|nr:hypothetical protein [Deltaproteobacteria bacterium]
MSIGSINNYGMNMSLVDFMTNDPAKNSETEELNQASLIGRNVAARQAYGSNRQSAIGLEAINRALSEIQPNSNGAITFKMITEHQAQREEEFTTLIKAGLLAYGADPEVEFQMVATPEGEIQINCNDPEQKKIIEQFFEDNPELKEDFLYIQALGNMDRAQQSATATSHRNYLEGTKSGLQSQAMEAFFNNMFTSGSVGYSSIMAEFGLENADYFMGANYFV